MTITERPLVEIMEILGISRDAIHGAERADRLIGTFQVASTAVSQLRAEHFSSVLDMYGDAATFEFKTGDLSELKIVGSVEAGQLDRLARDAAAATDASYDLVVDIDKFPLAVALGLPPDADVDVKLFFFAKVLVEYVQRGPQHFQRALWQRSDRRLLILVLDTDLSLSGDAMSLLGGSHLDSLGAESGKTPRPDLQQMATRRNDYVGWEGDLSTFITPGHLRHPPDSVRGEIGPYLDTMTIGLSVMFLCDRARLVSRGDGTTYVQAEFRGREHVAFVPVEWAEVSAHVEAQHASAIIAVVDWCYESVPERPHADMLADRLPFVQTRVAQLLESRPETERFAGLALAMPAIQEGVKWHWRSFVEGRVAEYLGQVRELEDAVGDTVGRLSDQTASLVKRLSETSLAAVAALIGSFIAATFKDPFQSDLFRIAMLAYAGYVAVFPLLVGVSSTYGEAQRVAATFAIQRRNLSSVLGADRVEELVAGRTNEATERFHFWVAVVVILYLVAIAAAVVAALLVPAQLSRTLAP